MCSDMMWENWLGTQAARPVLSDPPSRSPPCGRKEAGGNYLICESWAQNSQSHLVANQAARRQLSDARLSAYRSHPAAPHPLGKKAVKFT
jgi:hypothetical protein